MCVLDGDLSPFATGNKKHYDSRYHVVTFLPSLELKHLFLFLNFHFRSSDGGRDTSGPRKCKVRL